MCTTPESICDRSRASDTCNVFRNEKYFFDRYIIQIWKLWPLDFLNFWIFFEKFLLLISLLIMSKCDVLTPNGCWEPSSWMHWCLVGNLIDLPVPTLDHITRPHHLEQSYRVCSSTVSDYSNLSSLSLSHRCHDQ